MPSQASIPLLRVENVEVQYGGIRALDSVSFDIQPGQVFGLIGPNGAGKTTLFNCLSRLSPVHRGNIFIEGRDLLNLPIHSIAAAGIGRTFQNLALFGTMSVRENIIVGQHSSGRSGFIGSILRSARARSDEAEARYRTEVLIQKLDLQSVSENLVNELPFGIRKRVEMARALGSGPKLLLLDEPAAGLNHDEIRGIDHLIRFVQREFGCAVLLVEHHMGLVMGLCERIAVLNFGRKIAEGTPDEVSHNAEVLTAYLGTAT